MTPSAPRGTPAPGAGRRGKRHGARDLPADFEATPAQRARAFDFYCFCFARRHGDDLDAALVTVRDALSVGTDDADWQTFWREVETHLIQLKGACAHASRKAARRVKSQ